MADDSRRARVGRWTPTVVGVLACLVLTACTGSTPGADGPSRRYVTFVEPDERRAAPVITGPDLDGDTLSTADHAGKILVINLWGTWCEPCRKEAPVLREVSEAYAPRDVQFLGMVNDSGTAQSRAFNAKAGITYPSFADHGQRLELAFRSTLPARAIPATWILDHDGRVAAQIVDPQLTESTLTGVLDDVLGEAAAG